MFLVRDDVASLVDDAAECLHDGGDVGERPTGEVTGFLALTSQQRHRGCVDGIITMILHHAIMLIGAIVIGRGIAHHDWLLGLIGFCMVMRMLNLIKGRKP